MSESELTEAIGRARDEIKRRKLQPDHPATNQKERIMATKKKGETKSSKSEAKPEKAEKVEGYTAENMATDLGTTSVQVRRALRDTEAKKPGNRWVWPNATAAKEVRAQVKEWIETDARAKSEAPAKKAKPAKKSAAPAEAPAEKKAPAKKAAPKRLKKKAEAASE